MRVWWTAAVVLVLPLSGCGGSSHPSAGAYRADLARVARESDAAQGKVGKGFQAASVAQLVNVLRSFAASEKHIGDQVAALKAPRNAQAANTELAKGMHDTAAEIHGFLPRIEKMPSAKAAIGFLQKTPQTNGGREIDHALATLKRLGYIKKVS